MSKTYRVGIIGFGLSANVFHIPYIQANPNLELRVIVDVFGTGAQAQHPECTIYNSTDDLWTDKDIDLVVVSTPPTTHFELAAAALNAGKHGKPIFQEPHLRPYVDGVLLQWSLRNHFVLPVRNVTS